ncbi:hypothetical protein ACQFME_004393 [Escherichia coli]|uniref:hypothetical protein n=1 Tax=Escherichia coli TaxID=562 RepID=UPI0012FF5BBE|nr:hypothetical protein [Escherichia coli]ELO0115237.1 hypothetical protein [Escherichia coli O157]EFB2482968.1 hypothetical protein [Escherichia coli]EFC4412568.1 hypothetical protein [Escherichia coli]EFD0578603.1 hypothetical protein [Escherichia coli]EFD0944305.1 hypothetical protein [Escherichia coli]
MFYLKWGFFIYCFFMSVAGATENGDTRFSAKVFCGTCDIAIYVDGVVAQDVYMGNVTLGETSAKKTFIVKAADPSKPECRIFATSGKYTNARITLASGALNKQGLGNWLGTATDAWVRITPVNALKNNDVTFRDSVVSFPIDKLISDGFQFDAFLKGGKKSGTYQSGVVLSVAYL